MKEVNLYIDESGNLGSGMGRYFLICALELTGDKKALLKRSGRIISRFKIKHNITKELKGWSLKENDRIELIESILYTGINVRYIVLDLNHTTMLLTHSDDKNACFNYLIQLIIKQLINENPLIDKVNLYLDNRTSKIGNRLSLKPYLYNKLVLEKLESQLIVKRIEFNINYLESSSCYLIEWADIIANSLYKKYNSNDDKYYKLIKSHIIYESKYPSHNFGK